MELYDRIKARREELGISQGELAEMLGYRDRSTIAKIENGTNDLTQSKINAFADKLDTTPQYLMGWTNDPYDYFSDPDDRMVQIPVAIYDGLRETYGDDLEAVWNAWQKMEADTMEEQMGLIISSDDPQITAILQQARQLNAQGLERLQQYAEDLVDSGKYQK